MVCSDGNVNECWGEERAELIRLEDRTVAVDKDETGNAEEVEVLTTATVEDVAESLAKVEILTSSLVELSACVLLAWLLELPPAVPEGSFLSLM